MDWEGECARVVVRWRHCGENDGGPECERWDVRSGPDGVRGEVME